MQVYELRRTRGPAAPGARACALSLVVTLFPTLLLAGCDARPGGGTGEEEAPTVVPEAEEVFRIGSVSGATWDGFSRIVAAAFDEEANLHLLDADDRRIVVVDREGGLVRTIGRAGDGPGEFRSPVAMALLPGGQIIVSDTGHRGFLLFDAEGSYLRPVPFGDGVAAPSILHPDGGGGVVFASRGMMISPGMGGTPQGASTVPVRRVEVREESPPELLYDAWLPPRAPPQVSEGGGGVRMMRPVRAFEPQLHVAVLPDGAVAVVDSTTYRIHVVRPGHGIEKTLERPVEPRRTTERERELEKARRLAELQSGAGPPPQVSTMRGPAGGGSGGPDPSQLRSILEEQLENNLVFWPEIPVIQQLAADREGRIWVERFGGVGEPGPIEIMDAGGALRAVVPPNTLGIPAAFGPDGLAAWVERDELDVPVVRVARLGGIP